MQPPSLLSSLSEITESQEPVLEPPRHCPPVLEPLQPVLPTLPLLHGGGDASPYDDARRPTSS